MRVLDEQNNEIINPDLETGYLKDDKVFVAHHDAIPAVEEQFHYETTKVYDPFFSNLIEGGGGGSDIRKVIDVPARAEQPAWDEYEDIQRYVKYSEEEGTPVPSPSPEPTPAPDLGADIVTNSEIKAAIEEGVNSI